MNIQGKSLPMAARAITALPTDTSANSPGATQHQGRARSTLAKPESLSRIPHFLRNSPTRAGRPRARVQETYLLRQQAGVGQSPEFVQQPLQAEAAGPSVDAAATTQVPSASVIVNTNPKSNLRIVFDLLIQFVLGHDWPRQTQPKRSSGL